MIGRNRTYDDGENSFARNAFGVDRRRLTLSWSDCGAPAQGLISGQNPRTESFVADGIGNWRREMGIF
jgi:hypothetical protein